MRSLSGIRVFSGKNVVLRRKLMHDAQVVLHTRYIGDNLTAKLEYLSYFFLFPPHLEGGPQTIFKQALSADFCKIARII